MNPRDFRVDLIRQIESARESRVLCYLTGGSQPFPTQIAEDAVKLFHGHLSGFGKVRQIDLLLCSRGGDMLTPLRLVPLIREFCERFCVLVPYRAHSAATSIALGADEIVMGPLAELTPIDPTTGHPFNPPDPANPNQRLPIGVEDITSFLGLARDRAGVEPNQMVEVFRILSEKVNPLALGNAYRTYRMARQAASKLLMTHMSNENDGEAIEGIVKKLTEELCIHGYPIFRAEARSMGLKVPEPNPALELLMWKLYESYETLLEHERTFNPGNLLGEEDEVVFRKPVACVESTDKLDLFVFNGKVIRLSDQMGTQNIQVQLEPQGWFDASSEGV